MKTRSFLKGQSLFEVVFAIGIIAMVTVAIVSVSTVSIRNNISSKNKSLSTKYVNEAMEWLRSERDKNWNEFRGHAAQPKAGQLDWKDYCMEIVPPNNWGNDTDLCDEPDEYISGTQLYRMVSLARDYPNSETTVHAKVTVEWEDTQGIHSSSSYMVFTSW